MNPNDALADQIVSLCRKGRIRHRFGVRDVRGHFENDFAENHIKTVLANYAIGGYFVRRGRKARFKRVGRGEYEIVSS